MKWNKAAERALLLLIILAGTALRMYHLGAKGFWGDEIWTAQRSAWTPAHIVDFSLDNTVGPWTYLAGRAALLLLGPGFQEFTLRWPSVLASVLAIALMWALARRLYGKQTALAAAALLAAAPLQVWYAQEARYYAWLVVFSLAACYFLYRAFEEPQRLGLWAGFGLATVLNIYNHPLSALLAVVGLVPFGLIYGYRKPYRALRLARLAVSCVAIGLAVLPLVLRTAAVGQLNTEDISTVFSPTLDDWLIALLSILGILARNFSAEGWVQGLLLAAALAGAGACALAKQWRQLALLAPPLLLAPLFFAIAKYPFILRYVLFLQPLYLLLAARGVMGLAGLGARLAARRAAQAEASQPAPARGAVGPVLAAAMAALILAAFLRTTGSAYAQAKTIDWRSLAGYVQAHAQPADVIITAYPWADGALRWYFDPSFQIDIDASDGLEGPALRSDARQIWLIQPIEQASDLADVRNPLSQIGFTPNDDWQDPRLNYTGGFFPISELPARLYVSDTRANWIRFAGVPHPKWTDRPYSQIAPGETLSFSLTLPSDAARELWITFFDHPNKALLVTMDGGNEHVIKDMGGGWQTARLPVPEGLGDVVSVTAQSVGSEIAGISHAGLREAPLPAAP